MRYESDFIGLCLAAATLFSNCTKNMKCKNNNSACEKTVILNKELYAKTSTDNYMITSFDLTPLRIKGTKNISLSISGSKQLRTYKYYFLYQKSAIIFFWGYA